LVWPEEDNFMIRQAFWLWLLGTMLLWLGAGTLIVQAQAGRPYTIQGDDTLWKLAEKYLGDGHRYLEVIQATQIKAANDPSFASITNPNIIHIGDKVWIPDAGSVVVPPIEVKQPPVAAVDGTSVPPAPMSLSGQLALSFWNNAPGRCTYEINILNVAACVTGSESCQSSRRIFALNNASEPALSPDGQRLAFRGWGAIPERYKDDQLDHPYYGCPGPHADRFIGHTTLDGTDYYNSTGYWEDSHPDWSPDGTRILFDTSRLGDGITRIMMTSADGAREEVLRISGQQPSWAPDNDRFVYRGCDVTGNRCGLWLGRAVAVEAWDLGTNMIGPLLEEPEAAHPDWSPVGGDVVFQSPAAGSWDIYIISEDGSERRQLTYEPGLEGLPVWSPEGDWIAYLSDSGDNWGIWVIRPDGSGKRQLFVFDGGGFTPLAVPPYGVRDWIDEQLSWSR
jgi:hypothetical protein